MEVVIKTDKLTKRFGDFVATNEITFEVSKGEIFGFLGANGAGKTTAMRMLCGYPFHHQVKQPLPGLMCTNKPKKSKRTLAT
jgi:ABC-2 type transport system ATP-binding protein